MNTEQISAADDQSLVAGPSTAVAQRMEELDARTLQMSESQAQQSEQWLQGQPSSDQEPPVLPSSANYPGVFNIDHHEWSPKETSHLIAAMLRGKTLQQIASSFASSSELFSWPFSHCRNRVIHLAAVGVSLPRNWLVPNTLQNPPYIPQLSPDEEAELRLFVHTGEIYTDYVFRDYRTYQWILHVCHELYLQRANEPELWLAKYNTAKDATTHRRQGIKDRWLQWRQETTERRERLEAAQRQRLVSDEEIAGWENG